MAWLLGVDAGGTHTRAAVVNGETGATGQGSAGPGNLRSQRIEDTLRALEQAMAMALGEAGLHAHELSAACFGLAGLRSAADAAALEAALQPFGLGGQVTLVSDLVIAHRGSLEGEAGIHLIAGTGSSAFGRNAAGRGAQAGGWGWRIDDPGSAYWMGTRLLERAVREADGREPRGAVLRTLMQAWELDQVDELLPLVYDPDAARAKDRVARLSRVVMALAEGGDSHAQQWIKDGADELARLAETLVRRLDLDPVRLPVALTGGLGETDVYGREIAQALKRRLGPVALRTPAYNPLAGALLLAADSITEPISPPLIRALGVF